MDVNTFGKGSVPVRVAAKVYEKTSHGLERV